MNRRCCVWDEAINKTYTRRNGAEMSISLNLLGYWWDRPDHCV
ncbi:hypothetical protein ACVXHA_27445 [Escherichia coli]